MNNKINVESEDIGYIQCDINEIRGDGNNINPRLIIPLKINSNNPGIIDRNGKKVKQHYKIITLSSNLYIKNSYKTLIGQSYTVNLLFNTVSRYKITNISIPLDFNKIEYIENNRISDANFELEINLLTAKYEPIDLDIPHEYLHILDFVDPTSSIIIDLKIPESIWVKNILPEIGYGQYSLIEIPIPAEVESDKMKTIIKELDEAFDYFKKGDYNKVVAHCRIAIDSIPNLNKISKKWSENPKYRDRLEAFVDEYIKNELGKEKSKQIVGNLALLWDICSKSVHPKKVIFNREDAIYILGNTSYLVKYIANILKINEKI